MVKLSCSKIVLELREIKGLELKRERLNQQLAMAQKELESVIQAEVKLTQESYTPEDVAQLDAGMSQLKSHFKEQEDILQAVKRNLPLTV